MKEARIEGELKAARAASVTVQSDPRRWKALFVLALVQFMLVLDVTVVNVALPRIQQDLGFTHSGLAWVVNGYVLMAGRVPPPRRPIGRSVRPPTAVPHWRGHLRAGIGHLRRRRQPRHAGRQPVRPGTGRSPRRPRIARADRSAVPRPA